MFPLNLQRNIAQLDRQISLLENECKSMELDSRKKSFEPDPSYYSSSKIPSTIIKHSTAKVPLKKYDSCKKSKKLTPPVSARLQCANSLSGCTKTLNERGSSSPGRKTRVPPCTCQVSVCSQCNSKKEHSCVKCIYCNEEPVLDFGSVDVAKNDCSCHKEVVSPYYDGDFNVTVIKKSKNEKEILKNESKSPIKNTINLEHKVEKDGGCKFHTKGPNWSDILCLDMYKKKVSSRSGAKNKVVAGEKKTTNQPMNKKTLENHICEYHKNYSAIEEESFQTPIKLPSQSSISKQEADNHSKVEKDVQCSLGNCACKEPVKDTNFIQFLVEQIRKMPKEEIKKISPNADRTFKEEKCIPEEVRTSFSGSGDFQNDAHSVKAMKHVCDTLIKEKMTLSQELQTKENTIGMMKKREEEYLSLIASLKSNLETVKGNSNENADTMKEVNMIKDKLLHQVKVSETLKKNHILLQKMLEQCSLENDKLKTQIKIFKLEAKKHEILLAGKQAEIDRYKEEIQNFQHQISDHLATLKSNSEAIDIEKMIEAIVQQSQVFAQTEVESVLEKDPKDSSKSQNNLVHSSPNTTKTSVVNSSWKQISSIHDQDQSKANSDVAIYLNDDSNDKNFFQLFENNSFSEFVSPKKLGEALVENKRNVKRSSSFTSCISAGNDVSSTDHKNSDRDSLISFDEKSEELMRNSSHVSVNKAQSNIDELLKNMKLKFSKEVFETSLPSCASEDFLYISQISSISQC